MAGGGDTIKSCIIFESLGDTFFCWIVLPADLKIQRFEKKTGSETNWHTVSKYTNIFVPIKNFHVASL